MAVGQATLVIMSVLGGDGEQIRYSFEASSLLTPDEFLRDSRGG